MLSAKYAMCVALHPFRSSSCEEVDCLQDDLLEIISTLDDQWLVVRNTMMRKGAGHTYGLLPRKLVAMLSHDGTSWFIDEHIEPTNSIVHRTSTRSHRSKTPPPTYDNAMATDEDNKDTDPDITPMSAIETTQNAAPDLLSRENDENDKASGITVLMEGTLLYRTEAQQRMKQDQFKLTANAKLQCDKESFVIDESARLKQNNSTFELKLGNTSRTVYFDARVEATKWVQAIKYLISIQRILQRTPMEHLYTSLADTFQKIAVLPGNDFCADCGGSDPDVASLMYGVMLCGECGAVHASMRTRMQRLRVPNAQNAKCMIFVERVMCSVGGNTNASIRTNQVLSENASRLDRARYIHAKYKQSTNTEFETLPGTLDAAIALTIGNNNRRQQFNPNAQHRLTSATNLHLHVRENNLDVIAVLMFMGADPMVEDESGLSALELSIQLDHLEAAEVIAREWQLRYSTSNTIL